MKALDEFFDNLSSAQWEYFLFLHDWLTREKQLDPKIRWHIPFYYQHSWVCYLNPLTENTLEFCFLRGNELVSNSEFLIAKDRKQVRGLELDCFEEPPSYLDDILDEAIQLDLSKHDKKQLK